MLKTTEGRALLWHLAGGAGLEGSGALDDSFVPGAADLSAYKAGRQSMAKMVLSWIMEPKRHGVYELILKEQGEENK